LKEYFQKYVKFLKIKNLKFFLSYLILQEITLSIKRRILSYLHAGISNKMLVNQSRVGRKMRVEIQNDR
jgi:hypothetical protein